MEKSNNELVEILDEVMEKSNKNLLSNLSELLTFFTNKELDRENVILTSDEVTKVRHTLTESVIVLSYKLREKILKDVYEIFEDVIVPPIKIDNEWFVSKTAYGFLIDEKEYFGRFYISKEFTDELVDIMGISLNQFFDMILNSNIKKIEDTDTEFQHSIKIETMDIVIPISIQI